MKLQIQSGLEELGVPLPHEEVFSQFEKFVAMLLEKNKVMNLTSITEEREIVGLHLLDSATLVKFLPKEEVTLIDLGTGAGFPAIPLKILCPPLKVTLMDALEKRLNWLEEVVAELGLEDANTLHGRGEELCRLIEHREKYQFATARAVADLGVLAEISLPFVAVGGKFLVMKSVDTDEEIKKAEKMIETLGGKVSQVEDIPIPQMGVTHRVVVVEKVLPSPTKYPRRWAKIKKENR